MPRKGIGGHTRPNRGATDEWITPPVIIKALGRFDIDPCASLTQPWPCARRQYTIEDDGLAMPWKGRAYVNPPYSQLDVWMTRLGEHGSGTALIFARTETRIFEAIWRRATAVLFLRGRLYFYRPDGTRARSNSGGPSILVAYGERDARELRNCGLPGAYCRNWEWLYGKGMGQIQRRD